MAKKGQIRFAKLAAGSKGLGKGLVGGLKKTGGSFKEGFGKFKTGMKERKEKKEAAGAAPGGTPPPSAYMPSTSGGGGGGRKIPWGAIGIIALVVIVAIVIVYYLISVGFGIAAAPIGYQVETGLSSIWESFAIKRFVYFIQNPLGVRPEMSETEKVQEGTTGASVAPNQAFKISMRKFTDMVQYDQSSLTFVLTFKNEGSSTIKEADIRIFSEEPDEGCIRFSDTGLPSNCFCVTDAGVETNCGSNANEVKCKVEDVGPYAQKDIVIANAKIDGQCMKESVAHFGEDLSLAPATLFVNAKASTYYPTSSRLAVERIKTDYGVLLFQNKILLQQETGGVARAGSAMRINLDIGDQPILDSVEKAGLLMNWVNMGSGKMDEKKVPFIFIVTPGNFGPCVFRGLSRNNIVLIKGDQEECRPTAENAGEVCVSKVIGAVRQPGESLCGLEQGHDYGDLEDALNLKYIRMLNAVDSGTGAESAVSAEYGNKNNDYDVFYDYIAEFQSGDSACGDDDKDKEDYEERIVEELAGQYDCFINAVKTYEGCFKFTGPQGAEFTECNSIDLVDDSITCTLCDGALISSWCDSTNSPVYDQVRAFAPAVEDTLDWVCSRYNENTKWDEEGYHICATNGLTEEFGVFTCPLDLCSVHKEKYVDELGDEESPCVIDPDTEEPQIEIQTDENRVTKYVTALSVYPYSASTSTTVKVYCVEGACP